MTTKRQESVLKVPDRLLQMIEGKPIKYGVDRNLNDYCRFQNSTRLMAYNLSLTTVAPVNIFISFATIMENIDSRFAAEKSAKGISAMVTIAHENHAQDDEIITKARQLFNKINETTGQHAISGVHDQVSREIALLMNQLNETESAKAKFYIYKACDLYCILYKMPEERLPYLQKMIAIIDDDTTGIDEREKTLTRFKFADVLYDENKIEEAHNYIYNLYKMQRESFRDLLSGYLILIETAILLKKYDVAENVLADDFGKSIELKREPFCRFGHLNYIKLYLHQRNYHKAIAHIIEAKNMRNTSLNMLQEAQMRIYETLYFFMVNDVSYAEQLITINLKFCEYHAIGERSPQTRELFYILNDLIHAYQYNTGVAKTTMDVINRFQTGQWTIFGKLLFRLPKKLSGS